MTFDASIDPQDMHGALRAFPDHLAEGWRRGASPLSVRAADLDGVLVCGMGGSAIGGDLMRGIVAPTSPVPVQVNRSYHVPGWVSADSLVIVSSYSGGTEETLSAFEAAQSRDAHILAVTSGGDLAARCGSAGLPWIEVPGGLQPRAALGYSLGVLLHVAQALGLHEIGPAVMETAVAEARDRVHDFSEEERTNYAREVSGGMLGHLPVIYCGDGALEPVALRWQTQIHENAKHPAVGNVFPELNHNEIVGFEEGPDEILNRMAMIVLRSEDDPEPVARRIDVTRGLVARRVSSWREVEASGSSRLSRMLSLIQLGDWVSFWLAVRKEVDPTPVDIIQNLKRTLAEGASRD